MENLKVMSMNLDLIRTFVVVVQSGTYLAAAEKLGIYHSNVSRHIKKLEEELNVKLISRSENGKIVLTESGKELFDGFERSYNLLCVTEKKLNQKRTLDAGKLSIGVSKELEQNYLDQKIIDFKTKFPNVVIKIVNVPSPEMYGMLDRYYIDFIIDDNLYKLNKSSFTEIKKIENDSYCIIYNKDYEIKSLEDLNGKKFILPHSSASIRKEFDSLMEENKLNYSLSLEPYTYESAKMFAQNGLGLALVPKRLTLSHCEGLSVYELPLKENVFLAYVPENLSVTAKAFIGNLK